jgi:hypothetical protein
LCPKFAGIPGHLASPASGQSGQIESETLQNTSLTKMTGCITRGEPNVSRGGSHKDNFDLCLILLSDGHWLVTIVDFSQILDFLVPTYKS